MEFNPLFFAKSDPLEKLNLDARLLRGLRRAKITNLGQLIEAHQAGKLKHIQGFGEKRVQELEDIISDLQLDEVKSRRFDVWHWQVQFIEKQLSFGLLHSEARFRSQTIHNWIADPPNSDSDDQLRVLSAILSRSLNICEELTMCLASLSTVERTVLLQRYGVYQKTLQAIGDETGLSRERIRQIGNKLERNVGNMLWAAPTLRIQTAMLIARDLGLEITYAGWRNIISNSGLLGQWTSDQFGSLDAVDLMVGLCRLAENVITDVALPENLIYAIQLAADGKSRRPAKSLHILENISNEVERYIDKHYRFCGAVYVKWIASELQVIEAQAIDLLEALGYENLGDSWYTVKPQSENYIVTNHNVFHNALRKMFQYCGPLDLDDICSGIRHAVSRTDFPVPPPKVMSRILRAYNYESEDGLYYWGRETDEQLSAGEALILNCIRRNGPVVHHSELSQAFIDSELSFPSLHATLRRSPIFDRVDTGLYKLRGRKVTDEDMERARSMTERISLDLMTSYDRTGKMTLEVTLQRLALGTGVIFSDSFPNLIGEWSIVVRNSGIDFGLMIATETELRRLNSILEFLDCQTGDRLRLTFNMWTREVEFEKL